MPVYRYVVPDTSALAAAFYKEPSSANASPLLHAVRLQTVAAIAPQLILPEFLNVCRKKQNASLALGYAPVSSDDAEAIVQDFLVLPLVLEDMTALAGQAWRLHQDHGLETGDAFFLAAAQQWQAELWTADVQFFRRASAVYAAVYDLTATPFV